MSDRNVEYQITLRDRITGRLQGIDRQTRRTTRSFNMMNKVIGVLSVAAMVRFGITSIQTAAKYESFRKAIEFSSGNAIQARLNLEFLRETSDKLGISYEAAAKGFKMFSGGMRGSRFTQEQQRKMFLKISKATRVMQLSAEQTEGTFLALSQIMSKGRLQGEELLQINERIPGSMMLAQKAVGKFGVAFQKEMAAGKISADTFVSGFADQLENEFSGGVEKAVNSINAQLNKLENAWDKSMDRMGKKIASSGILSGLTDIIEGVNKDVDKLAFFEKKFLQETLNLGGRIIIGDEKGLFTQASFEQIDNVKKKIQEIQDKFNESSGKEKVFFQLKETLKQSEILARQTAEYEKQRTIVEKISKQNDSEWDDVKKREDTKLRNMRLAIALTKGISSSLYSSLDTSGNGDVDSSDLKSSDKELFGTTLTARSPKQFNINIESLIENFDVNSQTINEGAVEVKDIVVNSLIKGLAQLEQIAQ